MKFNSGISLSFPIHSFNPYVFIFLKNMNTKLGGDLEMYLGHIFFDNEFDSLVMLVAMLNKFIDAIKNEAESKEFKKNIANYQSNIIKNYRKFIEYINYLFDIHSSMLVLRVDFCYINDSLNNNTDKIKKMYLQARNNRNKLINEKPIGIFEHRVGYACKLEYSSTKASTTRCFISLMGKKYSPNINRVMDIGEYWKTTITDGKGLYYDYNNPDINNRRNSVIGIINRDDPHLRNELENAVGDLIKPDYYAKIDTSKIDSTEINFIKVDSTKKKKMKQKNFLKGEILKPKGSNTK